jgi:LacI family transcriptional regulator
MKKPSIHDVAKAAGVSIATVSRVINADPGVKDETRKTVLNAINLLQYRPSISARLMGGQRSYWVAMLYQNPNFAFIQPIQAGAEEACRKAGVMLSVHACQHTGADLIEEIKGIAQAFEPAGLILTPPLSMEQTVCKVLRELGIPLVRISPSLPEDTDSPCSPQIYFDDASACRELTEYLVSLGHRRIGFMSGMPEVRGHGVLRGYRDAMAAAGLNISAGWEACAFFQFDRAVETTTEMLRTPNRPTAIVTANDDMAAGCIRAAQALGLRVPEDVSVASVGNSYLAEIVSPRLTAIRKPAREMGMTAVQWILSGQAREGECKIELLPHSMVIGGSTAAPS